MPETDDIRWLIRFAQRLSGNAADGEDLAQDVLVALADAPQAPSRGFLATVTRNLFRMRQRARGRRQRRELVYATSAEDRPEPTEAAIAVAVAVRGVLDELDATTRSLLLARHLEDQTAEEIGARLGEPASTVRTRLSRARKRVREDLDARWRGDRPWAAIVAIPWSSISKAGPASTVGAGALVGLGGAALATVGVALGCAWALPDDRPAEVAAVAPAPKPAPALDTRINPDPRREAILRARARRLETASTPDPAPSEDDPDDFVEAMEAAFISLEPCSQAMQTCLEAAPPEASGIASVRAKIIGEPGAGAVVDTVEILEDAGQTELIDCMVEALFEADFPDPRDVVFDDYVFDADLDARQLTTTSGVGVGQLFDLLAAFPELEEELATAVENDPEIRDEVREELESDPERAADFPALQRGR